MEGSTSRARVSAAQSVAEALADFASVVGGGAAQAQARHARFSVALEEGGDLNAVDVAQQAGGVIIHLWNCASCCQCAFIGGGPDQAAIAGGLRAGENERLETRLGQRAGAKDGLHDR